MITINKSERSPDGKVGPQLIQINTFDDFLRQGAADRTKSGRKQAMKPKRLLQAMSFMGILATTAMPAMADQTPSTPAATASPCPAAQMGDQMRRMQAMHEAMLKAKPQERAKLMNSQMQLMHEGMDTMRKMSSAPMAGGMHGMGMRGGMAGAPGTCMNERMGMMEMMMQMMMDRMSSEHPAK